MQKGIIIAADKNGEDLLPWWWRHYSHYAYYSVAVVDLGMSPPKRAWCEERMHVIPLTTKVSVAPKESITEKNLKLWKQQYRGPLWRAREAWFNKPKACMLSPFEKTLWMDLDCEVCGPIDLLFDELSEEVELAIGLQDFRLETPVVYNSGVLLFRQGSPFLKEWDLRCQKLSPTMMGDQDVLTQMLLEGNISFNKLSPYFNWLMFGGYDPGIIIAHWAAGWGKEYIRKYGGLNHLKKSFAAV